MKNIKILSITALVLISAALFSSCNKYEQGPGISLRSKTARVVNHWKVQKVMWDGEDATDLMAGRTFDFKKDNTYVIYDDGAASENGIWSFIDQKQKLEMIDNDYPDDKNSFTILKLKDKEMIWEYTEDDEKAVFTFVKK